MIKVKSIVNNIMVAPENKKGEILITDSEESYLGVHIWAIWAAEATFGLTF